MTAAAREVNTMEQTSSRRLTLVIGASSSRWSDGSVMRMDALPMIYGAVANHDVERIILDRSIGSDAFLNLLAKLPAELAGDVLLVRGDGGAFLSAIGRGGDRVLYSLSSTDLQFYFETHSLTGTPADLAQTA